MNVTEELTLSLQFLLTNKNQLKRWIKDLNIILGTMKLLNKPHGEYFKTLIQGRVILDKTFKTSTSKAKLDKWNYITLRILRTPKITKK